MALVNVHRVPIDRPKDLLVLELADSGHVAVRDGENGPVWWWGKDVPEAWAYVRRVEMREEMVWTTKW